MFEFVDAFLQSQRAAPSVAYAVRFAAEEVFTNMVKYNPNAADVTLALQRTDRSIVVRFVDVEAKPFDVTAVTVDVAQPIEERRPGRLGLLLLKKMMDSVEYAHDGVHSRITMTKCLEP